MAIAPDDRVLEIGCGRGGAVALICERLTTGKITAIDRSGAMIRFARQRNASHAASGKAEFHVAAVDSADLAPHSFDKIFAVNVSLFWMGTPSAEIETVKRLLVPAGTIYVFHETVNPSRADTIGAQTSATLTRHGFMTSTRGTTSRRGLPITCVSGISPTLTSDPVVVAI